MATSRPGFRIEVVFCLIALTMQGENNRGQGSKQDAATAYDTVHEVDDGQGRGKIVPRSRSGQKVLQNAAHEPKAGMDQHICALSSDEDADLAAMRDQVQFRKGELWEDRHHLLAELVLCLAPAPAHALLLRVSDIRHAVWC
eukprot:1667194-Rhodomonas_salina.1